MYVMHQNVGWQPSRPGSQLLLTESSSKEKEEKEKDKKREKEKRKEKGTEKWSYMPPSIYMPSPNIYRSIWNALKLTCGSPIFTYLLATGRL